MGAGADAPAGRPQWQGNAGGNGQWRGRDWQSRGQPVMGQPANPPVAPTAPPPVVSGGERQWRGGAAGQTPNGGWQANRGDAGRRETWQGNRQWGDRNWQGDRGNVRGNWHDGRAWPDNRNWQANRGWQDQRGWQGYRGGWQDQRGWQGNRPAWSRNWRQDNRYDWRGWRNGNRDVFRAGRYRAPFSDFRYSRLNAGFFLNPVFFGNDYLIADPWAYRLPPADGPYRWVRYGDDVVLVDIYTGEVMDVIYDFFW